MSTSSTRVYEWRPSDARRWDHRNTPLDERRLALLDDSAYAGYKAEYCNSEVTFVAVRDNDLVGIAVCRKYQYNRSLPLTMDDVGRNNALEIVSLAAKQAGLALVEAVKEFAEHEGYNAVVLYHNFDANTLAFYRKAGFIDPGERPSKYYMESKSGDSGFRIFDITPPAPRLRRSRRLRS